MSELKTRILVVDDDADMARMIARRLKREPDFDVSMATAPAIAAITAKRSEFDVIVSDIQMPGMNGLELIRTLRAFDLDLPVILVTGTPAIESAQRAVELGAFRYLIKPVESETLISAVRQASANYKIAVLKRRAAKLLGRAHLQPADWIGLTQAFESALKSLRLAFQPIAKASDGTLFGFEALIRTENDRIPNPGALLDSARELGRLGEVTTLVAEKALEMMQNSSVRIFLNVLPEEMNEPSFPAVLSLLSGHPVVLELSDHERIDKVINFESKLASISDHNIQVAIDDLGVGRAGLGGFAVLTPLYAKVDMSLVFGIDSDLMKQEVVSGLVDVCHAESIIVIAEGIETADELRTCMQLGCDLLQGHYLGEPGFDLASPRSLY